MPEIADLHTHTHCSDGALTPEELILKASKAGVKILSVTDHDNINGICEALETGNKNNVTVLPGIEISAAWNGREVHILGYCFDPSDKTLRECLTLFREQRVERTERIIKKLNALNIPLTIESVVEQAGDAVLCRPHIAEAMVVQQLASSFYEVFQKYIGDCKPAYEKKAEFPLAKAIELIAHAGGLSFLAHPSNFFSDNDVTEIIRAGIDGIEVVHPSHNSEQQRHYRGIVNEYYLLECGGSDFHGGPRNDERNFGQYGVTHQSVERMQQRLNTLGL